MIYLDTNKKIEWYLKTFKPGSWKYVEANIKQLGSIIEYFGFPEQMGTTVEIIDVDYNYDPPEPSVGWEGGTELLSATLKDDKGNEVEVDLLNDNYWLEDEAMKFLTQKV